ncbi:VWA domain-containing protein [Pseudonocardia sichuanensis]
MKSINLVKDPAGAPAVDLAELGDAHVNLAKRAQKAGISLSKRDLAGVRAQAVLLLDHSASMRSDYKNGTVQMLVERALGFALQIDIDGEIPVIPFDSRVWPTTVVGVHNYEGAVDRDVFRNGKMGSTNLAGALQELLAMAGSASSPIFAIIVTDGSPDSRTEATRLVCELAAYPVFIKFLAIRPVDYLQTLDDLGPAKRLLDNVDAKFVPDPGGMSDLAFADAMVDEWDSWIKEATGAGVLSS